jgi:hypothetical protein
MIFQEDEWATKIVRCGHYRRATFVRAGVSGTGPPAIGRLPVWARTRSPALRLSPGESRVQREPPGPDRLHVVVISNLTALQQHSEATPLEPVCTSG